MGGEGREAEMKVQWLWTDNHR